METAAAATPVEKIVTEGREIIAVSASDTLTQVIRTLGQAHIFSAPVIRQDGLAAGFVDWLDILGHLIEVVSEEKQSRVTPASRSLTTDDMSMIMDRANNFALRTVEGKALPNKSKKDPWKTIKMADNVQKATNVLSLYHHVALERDGKLVNILSQMDLLRWLQSDTQRMGADGRKTLQGLHLHRKRVVCVRETDLTIDAFYTIYKAGVSGAGVLDEAGKLVGCLSASDLKLLAESYDFTLLLKSVKDFLAEEGSDPIAMHHFDTLGDVVAKMVAHHVHRVFIVGPGGYPMGVVTTTDVCGVFAQMPDTAEKAKDKKNKGDKKGDKKSDKKSDKKDKKSDKKDKKKK